MREMDAEQAEDDFNEVAEANEDRDIDVPALRKALEHITAHPEEWNQDAWATQHECGTSYCLAGIAAVQAGHSIDWTERSAVTIRNCEASSAYTTTGRMIETVAMEALGLDVHQAATLFHSGNSLATLWSLANTMTGGEVGYPINPPWEHANYA